MSDNIENRREQVETLRELVDEDDSFDPGSEELDRLLDRIREQGFELRKSEDVGERHTTPEEFRERKDELIERAAEIRSTKNPDYAVADEDFHASFRKMAKKPGISEDLACLLLWEKHLLAIASDAKGTDNEASEEMDDRFADALNYLFFQYSLYRERQ